jgi:hypothetical protein
MCASALASIVDAISVLGPALRKLYSRPTKKFQGSTLYWQQRYAQCGHSGAGSRGHLAEFKDFSTILLSITA